MHAGPVVLAYIDRERRRLLLGLRGRLGDRSGGMEGRSSANCCATIPPSEKPSTSQLDKPRASSKSGVPIVQRSCQML